MFNSFIDGTKSAIEMVAVVNATGLTPAPGGLGFPPAGADELAAVCRPRADGGSLDHPGAVEVVSSLGRDGRPVERDLRWGVYVTFKAATDYVARCFSEYGLATDDSGYYAALYRPYHLIGLELGISVAYAALRGEATGAPTGFPSRTRRSSSYAARWRDGCLGEAKGSAVPPRYRGTRVPEAAARRARQTDPESARASVVTGARAGIAPGGNAKLFTAGPRRPGCRGFMPEGLTAVFPAHPPASHHRHRAPGGTR